MKTAFWFGPCIAFGAVVALAQPAARELVPNLESNIERPLRYRPDGADFVIENGSEFFNRPLYGGNTAFRVDGGDKPEFVLYLPGRGGNLRFGLQRPGAASAAAPEKAVPRAISPNERDEIKALPPRGAFHAKWLHDSEQIITRYRPGQLLYEIRDPLLGPNGVLRLSALASHQTEGLIVRIEATGVAPEVELVWAYGGVNGQRGTRDGDIGTERVPISQWFQLQPDFCKDNGFLIEDGTFTLKAKAATIRGMASAGVIEGTRDAANWNNLEALLGPPSAALPARPVMLSRAPLADGQIVHVSLERVKDAPPTPDLDPYAEAGGKVEPALGVEALAKASAANALLANQRVGGNALHLPEIFAETEAHFAALRERVLVVTPDPFINAAVGALNVAADAVWDEPQQAIMHGAIAWRTRLLGWRGPYALDALGWHERARKHFEYWATRQNTSPIPEKLPPPDANANLARSETALHSNGDLSNSHYDMNLVFIDALFRHLRWTGDPEFAKKMWPVIERHLAWERRLFRREFTTPTGEKLPLYEAYAAIWASDDLQYSGGGATHSSAYNYWHNRMAAQVAVIVGADAERFNQEADLIARGAREFLWLNNHFAEAKDWLGKQLVHPSSAMWTFYHVMDAELPTSIEASAMARFMKASLPRIPVRGPGVPAGLYVFATSNWMPYTWSLNNVTMNENVHTALAFWQAGRSEDAFTLLKSSLVASMFMGISPGNVGSMNYLDVYRRESQRDFADGSGVLSRALIEGLFGLKPDAFRGELTVTPRFPAAWSHASIRHLDVEMSFQRDGATDVYTFDTTGMKFTTVKLLFPGRPAPKRVSAKGTDFEGPLDINRSADGTVILTWKATRGPLTIAIEWPVGKDARSSGVALVGVPAAQATASDPPPAPARHPGTGDFVSNQSPLANAEMVPLAAHFNDRVTAIFQKGKYQSPRSPFVSLALPAQGIGYWAGHVNATAEIDDSGLRAAAAANGGRIVLPDGVPFATPGPGDAVNVLFTSQWDNYPREGIIPLSGRARRIHLLMAGSTNAMQSRLDNGEVIATYADGTQSRLALRNPETWWPIEQDYFIDDFQFRVEGPLPTRVDLKTGAVRVLEATAFKGQGRTVPGGAATVLKLELDPSKELKSLTVRALANDVVIGLLAATLER